MRGETRDAEFAEYVAARRPQLRRTAYLICGDSHRAEDLVQTALVKLYVAWPRVRRGGNVDAFTRRIIVNAHIDETRRPWRRELLGFADIDPPAPDAVDAEDRDLIVEALLGLPPGQRSVVVLRHYWGLSVDETATDLGISAGTVKSQTSAALRHLEQVLSPHYDRGSRT